MASMTDALRDPKGLLALLAIVALILYGLSVGRTRALVSLLSIYVAYVITVLFPYIGWLTGKIPSSYQAMVGIGLFIALYGVTFGILSGSLLKGRLTLGEISLWQVVVISIVQIGLLASICLSLLSTEAGIRVMGPLYRWFGGQHALWAWAVASLLIMPFMHGHRRGIE
jgi:hypothetical protein